MMSFSVLDSQRIETYPQLFTKPLRAVLGGREFTQRNSRSDRNVQDKAILEVWQRVLVAILLFTVALPYTFIAAVILAGTALSSLRTSKDQDGISEEDQKALSTIFDGSQIKFNEIKKREKPIDEDVMDANFSLWRDPTWVKVRFVNNDNDRAGHADYFYCLVIPMWKNKDNVWEVAVLVLSNQNGSNAPWDCIFDNKTNSIPLHLHNASNTREIQPLKDLLAGQIVRINNVEYSLTMPVSN